MSNESLGPVRRRRAVSSDPVVMKLVPGCGDLVCLVEPHERGLELLPWVATHREEIRVRRQRHGAVLLRGFADATVHTFEPAVESLAGDVLRYTERSSPRTSVGGRVYTSTEHPPDQTIFLHNEQSYNVTWPGIIAFHCVTAPGEGGATPLAGCRSVLRRIDADALEKLRRLGYAYVRNFREGIGLDWREAFQTDDRAVVESYCREHRMDFEWRGNEELRTTQRRAVVHTHAQTGDETWFNHLTFFHVSTLHEDVRSALLSSMGEEELPHQTYYGDGSPLEPDMLDHLRAAYLEEQVSFPWQEGDVLVVDNMLTAHGRAPFKPPRKIVVAMADPQTWNPDAVAHG